MARVVLQDQDFIFNQRIYDEFLDKLVAKAEKIKLGAPMDKDTQMGPLNSFKQLENIEKNIKATIEQGGKIRCGGKRSSISNKGYYFPATIIECKNHNLPAAENELFGPVLSVMKFDTEEEAIKQMNDNKYGLILWSLHFKPWKRNESF